MQTRQVAVIGPGRVEIHTARVADPGPGQVLVRAHRTLISGGTETTLLHRRFDEDNHHWPVAQPYPWPLGYSLAGEVVRVGPDTAGVTVGDRVGVRGPHTDYVIAEAGALFPIPDAVSFEEATFFGLLGITQNAVRAARQELGVDVLVLGLGLVGQLTAQFARIDGASRVIGLDRHPRRRALATSLGATTALTDLSRAIEEIDELTGDRRVDVCYDTTANPTVLGQAVRLTRWQGRTVLIGNSGTKAVNLLLDDIVCRGVTVVGTHDANPPDVGGERDYWSHQNMARFSFSLIAQRRLRVTELISHRLPADKAPAAYDLLRTDKNEVMGIVLDWTTP